MIKRKFKYDYKTAKQIAALDSTQLIAYKQAMDMQAENIKAEASEWAATHRILWQEMSDRIIDLECMSLGAKLDRQEASEDTWGVVGNLH